MERHSTIRTAYGLGFALNLFIVFATFYFPLYFEELGFNGLQIGLLFSLFSITALVSTFPTGISNDRITIKHILSLGYLLLALMFYVLSTSTNFWVFAFFVTLFTFW